MPGIWWFEIRNTALLGIRRNRITEIRVHEFLNRLGSMTIDIILPDEDGRIFVLAQRHRLTFYEAAYLNLALRERAPLAPLDHNLAGAAAAEGVALIGPS